MLRRLPADDSVGEALQEPGKPVRCVHAQEDGRRPRLVAMSTIPLGANLRTDYAKCLEALSDKKPSCLLIKLKDDRQSVPATDNDWAVIMWIPMGTPVPKANLLSNSFESVKEVLPEDARVAEITAKNKRDLGLEKFIAKVTELTGSKKAMFLDTPLSINGARVRLWLKLKQGMEDEIEVKNVTPDMEPWLASVNPEKRIPVFVREDTQCVEEMMVVLEYFEDKFSDHQPSFMPDSPEERQYMELLVQVHDLYLTSANCNEPGFSSSLDALQEKDMEPSVRAAKAAEIWKQLAWVNKSLSGRFIGPYFTGERLSLADITWFPTTVFLEFLLPRLFGWPEDLFSNEKKPLPSLAKWRNKMLEDPVFKEVQQQTLQGLEEIEKAQTFQPIKDAVSGASGLKFKYP